MEPVQISSPLKIDEKYLVEALFVHTSIGIIITHEVGGEIIVENPNHQRLFNYRPGELPGRSIESQISPRFPARHTVAFINEITEKPGQSSEYIYQGADLVLLAPTLLKYVVLNLYPMRSNSPPNNPLSPTALTGKKIVLSYQSRAVA